MEEYRVKSFGDLYEICQRFRSGLWVFRGVADLDYALVPKVGRRGMETSHEKRIFDFFEREAHAYLERLPRDDFEMLALAQHHGLPTRLLDWTENPMVAAFFACGEREGADGAIYMLHLDRQVEAGGSSSKQVSPFTVQKVLRYRPRHLTRRITVQRGLFTVHPAPEIPLTEVADSKIKVHRAIVEADFKLKLRWNLSRFGIHRASLFPDLDGLASHISWMFSGNDPSEEPHAMDLLHPELGRRWKVRRARES